MILNFQDNVTDYDTLNQLIDYAESYYGYINHLDFSLKNNKEIIGIVELRDSCNLRIYTGNEDGSDDCNLSTEEFNKLYTIQQIRTDNVSDYIIYDNYNEFVSRVLSGTLHRRMTYQEKEPKMRASFNEEGIYLFELFSLWNEYTMHKKYRVKIMCKHVTNEDVIYRVTFNGSVSDPITLTNTTDGEVLTYYSSIADFNKSYILTEIEFASKIVNDNIKSTIFTKLKTVEDIHHYLENYI